ncbi:hypothetical protein VP01_3948g2 [Puccinia sorghi]|uniref:Uncharacterized protein n=1 Tax=Puccinia sorghi TaxID=27349 RepID=A0A0L6UTA4_9BASI|nr:hypothetical protein VP01_3948g2 [Puccinia sorghi]
MVFCKYNTSIKVATPRIENSWLSWYKPSLVFSLTRCKKNYMINKVNSLESTPCNTTVQNLSITLKKRDTVSTLFGSTLIFIAHYFSLYPLEMNWPPSCVNLQTFARSHHGTSAVGCLHDANAPEFKLIPGISYHDFLTMSVTKHKCKARNFKHFLKWKLVKSHLCCTQGLVNTADPIWVIFFTTC